MPEEGPSPVRPGAGRDAESDSLRLLGLCASGNEREREAGFRELGRILYTVLWRQVVDRPELWHLAEESSQEALVIVWRHLASDRGPDQAEHFVGWAVVIASNKLREALRRREPRARLQPSKRVAASRQVSLDAPPPAAHEPLGELLAAGDSPQADAERQETFEALQRMVRESRDLSEASRTVLIKGYLEGWDDAELAEHLGTTRGNVHVLRCRGLARLRAHGAFMDQLARWLG
ncbi:MAG: sigma-70 family RNA polymerase sigma factor [Ardenticatenia bacterium]|nr:sigma-70 family RNA polymerase sigma factor [Ardenticatenia bacterium]